MSKFCKDCLHCERPTYAIDWTEFALCNAVKLVNPVSGAANPDYCKTQRMSGQSCGPDGALFMARTTPLRGRLIRSLQETPPKPVLTGTVN